MSRLGGLWRAMPWTAGLFALGAVAISGLPPLNGFVSEWLVYLGLFDATLSHGPSAWAAIPAAILLGVTGALALACFAKVCGVVFLGAPRSPAAAHAHESGPAMRGAMLVLGAACVAIGLAPVVFWPAVVRAMDVWNPVWAERRRPRRCRRSVFSMWLWRCSRWRWRAGFGGGCGAADWARALTWDCGYALPTARMQYTAGSFAGIINEWFAWILRPERQQQLPENLFPAGARHAEHTPETVLEKIVQPAALLVMRVSSGGAEPSARAGASLPVVFADRCRGAVVVGPAGGGNDENCCRQIATVPPRLAASIQPNLFCHHVSESHPNCRVVWRLGKRRGRLDSQRRPALHAGSGRLLFDRAQVTEWAAERGLGARAGFLAPDDPTLTTQLRLAPLLRTGGIWRDVPAADVPDVFARIITALPGATPPVRQMLGQRVRAKGGVTMAPVGGGFALPHPSARITLGRDSGTVALLLLRDDLPLPEPPPDGVPVRHLFFFIAPSPRGHLDLLARLSRSLVHGPLRGLVENGAPDAEIFQAVERDGCGRSAEAKP